VVNSSHADRIIPKKQKESTNFAIQPNYPERMREQSEDVRQIEGSESGSRVLTPNLQANCHEKGHRSRSPDAVAVGVPVLP
jgi:hypothetical protein